MKNLDGISIPFTISFFDQRGRQYVYTGCTDYEIKDGVLTFSTGEGGLRIIHHINLNMLFSITID
jgi:hypothetical protein